VKRARVSASGGGIVLQCGACGDSAEFEGLKRATEGLKRADDRVMKALIDQDDGVRFAPGLSWSDVHNRLVKRRSERDGSSELQSGACGGSPERGSSPSDDDVGGTPGVSMATVFIRKLPRKPEFQPKHCNTLLANRAAKYEADMQQIETTQSGDERMESLGKCGYEYAYDVARTITYFGGIWTAVVNSIMTLLVSVLLIIWFMNKLNG
jgi:hypothetical protein